MKRLELNENGILAAEKAHKIPADSKEMIPLIRSIDRERHTLSIGSLIVLYNLAFQYQSKHFSSP